VREGGEGGERELAAHRARKRAPAIIHLAGFFSAKVGEEEEEEEEEEELSRDGRLRCI